MSLVKKQKVANLRLSSSPLKEKEQALKQLQAVSHESDTVFTFPTTVTLLQFKISKYIVFVSCLFKQASKQASKEKPELIGKRVIFFFFSSSVSLL